MPSSGGSSVSDDGEMDLGPTRADPSEPMEDKVVEKSPKGRFHRVCRYLFVVKKLCEFCSLIGASEAVHTRRFIWRLTMTRGGKWRGM